MVSRDPKDMKKKSQIQLLNMKSTVSEIKKEKTLNGTGCNLSTKEKKNCELQDRKTRINILKKWTGDHNWPTIHATGMCTVEEGTENIFQETMAGKFSVW